MDVREFLIDCDDVIAEFMFYMVSRFGQPERWDTYNLKDMYPDEPEDRLWNVVMHPPTYRELLPIHGAAETLQDLYNAGLTVTYVTARPKRAKAITRTWLEANHFPNFKNVIVTEGHSEKIALLRDMEIWGLVEDRGSTLLSVNNYVKHSYLFDRPWNRGFKSLRRVLGWNHLKQEVLEDLKRDTELR